MNKLAAVLALSFAGAAWGQTGELWFNFGWSIMGNNGIGSPLAFGGSPSDVKLDDGYRFSFRFGFNQGDHFGHEIQYAFNHTQFDESANACGATIGAGTGIGTPTGGVNPCKMAMHFHQGGYNFLYYFTTDRTRIRPFATAGVGFNDFIPPGGAVNYGSQDEFGFNAGAGVKFHIHGMWAGRVDVREYTMPKPNFGYLYGATGWLLQTEASAGVGIGF
ncbi:MAG TPA: outer membrane beta-barrel protein [Bryobacteraceae bacterium]|nr:outer membrane beta-barrel protein [Bryobacteraceae bacterium]